MKTPSNIPFTRTDDDDFGMDGEDSTSLRREFIGILILAFIALPWLGVIGWILILAGCLGLMLPDRAMMKIVDYMRFPILVLMRSRKQPFTS